MTVLKNLTTFQPYRIPPPSDNMTHQEFLDTTEKPITAFSIFILNCYTSHKNDTL